MKITLENGKLHATNYGRTAIAGPRILRKGPHPQINWESPTQNDLEKLQSYLDALPISRKPTKAERRVGA